jgi:23S rRNA (uracil1939-C5)-methyltransferase
MEPFEGKVQSLAHGGRGIVLGPNQKVCFVEGVWPGDTGLFKIVTEKKNYAEAELVKLIAPSSDRREELPCRYQGFSDSHCGGCSWMIAKYPAQVRAKFTLVAELCRKYKLIENPRFQLNPIITSQFEFEYRNRAQFKTDGERVGFLAKSSHKIVDVKSCAVLEISLNKRLGELRNTLPNHDWLPRPPHKFRFLEVDTSHEGVSIDKRFPFMQGNSGQNESMKALISNFLSQISKETQGSAALEMFCGSGNFTEVLSNCNFEKIFAFEVSQTSIEALTKRGLKNVFPHKVDLSVEKFKPESFGIPLSNVKVLLLDPPREGWVELRDFVPLMPNLSSIIYVSCDPQTFFRDASRVMENGFEVVSLTPVDMFPQTPHIELVAILRRKAPAAL